MRSQLQSKSGNTGNTGNTGNIGKTSAPPTNQRLAGPLSLSGPDKLALGRNDDPQERQADHVAEQVTRMEHAATGQDGNQDEGPGNPVTLANTYASTNAGPAPLLARDLATGVASLTAGGRPCPDGVRDYFEPRFGHDFSKVRIHTDARAATLAQAMHARAFTVDRHIAFAGGAFQPHSASGRRLIAHELTHTLQAKHSVPVIRRYGTPIPRVANPSVRSMAEFIDLVRRVEAANPGFNAMQTAAAIMRTKYNARAWDYLLPSTAGGAGVSAAGGVTARDVTTLAGEFEVTLPNGGSTDPSHIVVAITATAETQAPGTGLSAGLPGLAIGALPSGLSQRDVATWVGDVASAAAEWATAHPHPQGGTTKQAYMDEFAPQFDLIADIDGIAMTSTSAAAGFAFNASQPLSDNLQAFYFPSAPRTGERRRFHTFCQVEGLALNADGITLSSAAISNIRDRVRLNADWFQRNDPNLLTWVTTNSSSGGSTGGLGAPGSGLSGLFNPYPRLWVQRANDWRWFADRFIDFVQSNLNSEGP